MVRLGLRIRGLTLVVLLCAAGCLEVPPNVDSDNDGVLDEVDNCPAIANPDQSDVDADKIGDACAECIDGGDIDADHDGIPDGCDGCIGNGMDADKDGIPDNCDGCVASSVDVDHDGLDDACDHCIGNGQDVDHDGLDDACDPCIGVESGVDADHDSVDDACDPCPLGPQHDEDMDSIFDACDVCPAVANFDQANNEESGAADQAGNACDGDANYNRQLFDAFDQPNTKWFIQGSTWSLSNDALYATGTSADNQPATRLFVASAMTLFTVKAQAAHDLGFGGYYGLLAASAYTQPSDARIECAIFKSPTLFGDVLRLQVFSGGIAKYMSSAFISQTTATLTLIVSDKEGQVTCSDGAGIEVTAPLVSPGLGWHAGLIVANVDAHFSYFDLITY